MSATTFDTRFRLRTIRRECRSVAAGVWGKTRPTPSSALRIGEFLFLVGAHESEGYTCSRQKGLGFRTPRGAFGYWQLQAISVRDTLDRLARSDTIRRRAAAWYFRSPEADDRFLSRYAQQNLMEDLAGNDRLALLFARLHFLWVPEIIPEDLGAMEKYWGEHYNKEPSDVKRADFLGDAHRIRSAIN